MQLILASSSPYRRQLLERLQLDFETASPDIDESSLFGETAREYVRRLSVEKSRVLAQHYPQALIIGSDQILLTENGYIQGKPLNHTTAVEQLKQVRNSAAKLVTGVAVYNTQTGSQQVDIVEYQISYRDYSDKEIESYLQREQPYHCAGALKSEGLGIALLSKLEGTDPTAIIGLPLIRLTQMLKREGLSIL